MWLTGTWRRYSGLVDYILLFSVLLHLKFTVYICISWCSFIHREFYIDVFIRYYCFSLKIRNFPGCKIVTDILLIWWQLQNDSFREKKHSKGTTSYSERSQREWAQDWCQNLPLISTIIASQDIVICFFFVEIWNSYVKWNEMKWNEMKIYIARLKAYKCMLNLPHLAEN